MCGILTIVPFHITALVFVLRRGDWNSMGLEKWSGKREKGERF